GILGTAITGSHSPRLHRPPFDRIDLPADAEVEAVVDALLPHYAGFSVTSPFKQRLARHLGPSGAPSTPCIGRMAATSPPTPTWTERRPSSGDWGTARCRCWEEAALPRPWK